MVQPTVSFMPARSRCAEESRICRKSSTNNNSCALLAQNAPLFRLRAVTAALFAPKYTKHTTARAAGFVVGDRVGIRGQRRVLPCQLRPAACSIDCHLDTTSGGLNPHARRLRPVVAGRIRVWIRRQWRRPGRSSATPLIWVVASVLCIRMLLGLLSCACLML